jgi:hypothetical protein
MKQSCEEDAMRLLIITSLLSSLILPALADTTPKPKGQTETIGSATTGAGAGHTKVDSDSSNKMKNKGDYQKPPGPSNAPQGDR